MNKNSLACEVRYGSSSLEFFISFTKRRSLAISVHPDTRITVTAPEGACLETIKAKVLKRAKWIKKQQRIFGMYPPVLPARRYVSGESFRYLGKQYILKVRQDLASRVKLEGNSLLVSLPVIRPAYVKELVDSWFKKRAEVTFQNRMKICLLSAKKRGVLYNGRIYLRAMKTRWGSCSKDGRLTLNPELVCAHKECIDYVILHELTHLKVYNHGPKFHKLLEAMLPDWGKRKEKLETTMEHRLL